jgi:hypothetical protein
VKSKRSKKRVTVELEFLGDGSVAQVGDLAFSGGVPPPRLGRSARFAVFGEHLGRDGLWNPRDGEPTVAAGFQISVTATSRGFRELGRYLLAVAEIDSSLDEDYHEHVEALSVDGRTRFHFILRKKP